MLGLKRVMPVGVAERITSDLITNVMIYDKQINQPLPGCKQCSELELLLILRRAIDSRLVNYPTPYTKKEDDTDIVSTMRQVAVKYEKKFAKPIPWWWVCSDKERLTRLEKSLALGVPYPDYSSRDTYKLGRALAEYEMWFKKRPPEWRCSNEERILFLERALEIDIPYITKEEDAELEIKLNAEYQKMSVAKTPVTDFERSVVSVYFEKGGFLGPSRRIAIAKAPTGAAATRLVHGGRNNVKHARIGLDIKEWLNFVRALYECRISKWEKEYYDSRIDDGEQWSVDIFFSDNDTLYKLSFWGSNAYPPNWKEFKGIMDDMEVKIQKGTLRNRAK
jgi:hypothetical protein